jgi:hypothetical protein
MKENIDLFHGTGKLQIGVDDIIRGRTPLIGYIHRLYPKYSGTIIDDENSARKHALSRAKPIILKYCIPVTLVEAIGEIPGYPGITYISNIPIKISEIPHQYFLNSPMLTPTGRSLGINPDEAQYYQFPREYFVKVISI